MINIDFIKRIFLFFFLFTYSLWGLEFTLTPSAALETTEANTSSYVEFSINITDSSDTEDETIFCSVNDGTEGKCTISGITTIPAGTTDFNIYNTTARFRVYGVADNLADGDQTYKVAIGTSKYSTGEELTDEASYGSDPEGTQVFTFTNTDNGSNSAAVIPPVESNEKIIVDLFDNTSSETGEKASFSVVLSQEPTDDVTISFNSTDTTEGTLSVPSITFTPSNWDERQRVDIIGVDDAIDDNNISFSIEILAASSNDPYYDGIDLDDINIINVDDDNVPSETLANEFIITTQNVDNPSVYDSVEGPIEILEGTTSLTYYVTLKHDPLVDISENVVFKKYTFSQQFITVTPNILYFDSSNYNIPQQITVSVDDEYSYGDTTEKLLLKNAYLQPWSNDLDFNIIEDDSLPINFNLDTTDISEDGTTATINISLDEVPASFVNFTIELLDPTECSISSTTLNFTSAEAITSKDIIITGLNDELIDFTKKCRIKVTWAPSNSDEKFNIYPGYSYPNDLVLYNTKFFEFKNTDNDTDFLTITPIDSTTSEDGDTASFSVVLNYQPDGFLRVNLNTTDNSEGRITSPSSSYLEFNETNWNIPQTVIVTGFKDDYLDDLINYSINLKPLKDVDDVNFDGTVTYRSVSLTNSNIDNSATINLDSSMLVKKGEAKTISYTYFQADNLVPDAKLTTYPKNGTIKIDGTDITYTPNLDFVGEDSFTVYFSLSNGYNESKTVDVSVKDIPIINNTFENIVVDEDSEAFSVELSNSLVNNNQDVIYEVTTSNNDIVNAYVLDGVLYIVPVKDAHGQVTISLTATIDGITSPTKSFMYIINSINDVPFIESINDIVYAQSSENISGSIIFEYFDDDEVSFRFTNSDDRFISNSDISITKISDTQAKLDFLIEANKVGTSNITIVATDNENSFYSESFNIIVSAISESLCVSNTSNALTFDLIKGENISQSEVTNSLDLISSIDTVCDSTITWESSDVSIVDLSGAVTQSLEESTIMLTATIAKGSFSTQKEFLITIPSNNISDEEAVNKLGFELIKGENQRRDKIVYPLELVNSIVGKDITWTSNSSSINIFNGEIIRGSLDTQVQLVASVGQASKTFTLVVLKEEVSDEAKVETDKNLLTINSILGKNIDENNIKYDLIKPLPNKGANGSTISWSSSNTNYISNSGDVTRDENSDKVVQLTATIEKGNTSKSKKFKLVVLQNQLINKRDVNFNSFENSGNKTEVKTTEDGEEKTTSLTFSEEILEKLEQVLSEDSIKTVVEFLDSIINIYLNSDGTSQTTVHLGDNTSSINVQDNASTTYIDENGSVVTQVKNENGDSITLTINSKGNVSFNMTIGTNSTNINSNIPGTSVEVNGGDIELSSLVEHKGSVYKVIIANDNNGNSTVRYERVDLETGETVSTNKTLSENTPFPPGSSLNINIIDGEIYISTTVPLDGNIVIE